MMAYLRWLSALGCLVWALLPVTTSFAKDVPNVLFAIADDWGCHAGAYGTKWMTTPNIDRVARDGVRFTRAYTPNAKCAPSRACILTGRNSWQLKEAANHICYFPAEFKGFCEALSEKGWFVGHTTKGWGPGTAKDAAGMPRKMTGKAYNEIKCARETQGIHTVDYAANFSVFLDESPKDKPWFFWYGAIEPHRSYEYGTGTSKGGKKIQDIDRVPGYWPDNETVRQDMLDYAYEVQYFDRHLGRMLEELEKRGELQNTVVVVTSDHGMPFPRCKGSVYADSNHIPLLVMWPRVLKRPGRVSDAYVSFIDLAPTFMDLAGIPWSDTGMADSPGSSLLPILKDDTSYRHRDHVLVGMERHDIGRPGDVGYPVRGIHQNDMLYLRNYEPDRWPACDPVTGYLNVDASPTKSIILTDHRQNASDAHWQACFGKRDSEELYDLKDDPDCMKNLAKDPALQQKLTALRTQMESRLREEGDPRMFGQGEIFDRYLHANPKHVNFYEKYMRGELETPGWVLPTDFETR